MKVVINKCFGGFGLSVKATQWLWNQGVKEIGKLASQHCGGLELNKNLERWREAKTKNFCSSFIPIFSDDEKYCLYAHNVPRNHPKLIQCVEILGEEANGDHSKLKIVEIPDGIEYEIDEYDGKESVHEVHETWS